MGSVVTQLDSGVSYFDGDLVDLPPDSHLFNGLSEMLCWNSCSLKKKETWYTVLPGKEE